MKKSIYLLLAIFLSACLPAGVQVPQSPLLSVLERKAGLIAYIGTDGNVYITDQGASKTSQLTKDATPPDQKSSSTLAYQNPTWSLDGSQLAYIKFEQGNSQLISKLFVANIDDDTIKNVYSSASEHPFYLYWSPDDANLSFLSSAATGQTMMLQSVSATGGDSRVLDTGSPFYWSWAPDGKTMIVHQGGGGSNLPNRLAFLKVDSGVDEYGLDMIPASFQAPAWSPDGKFILLTHKTDDGKQEILLADSTGKTLKSIRTFDLSTAFAWSFDSEQFAYIVGTEPLNNGTIGTLHVYDTAISKEIEVGKNVVGLFWSPNGKKLAYFVPYVAGAQTTNGAQSDTTTLILQLNMLDVATGKTRELFNFQPTDQFVSIIPYFDQYHQSTTIWSPDSNNLVLSFIGSDGKPGVAVVAASGQLQPRFIADGIFAVWSWK